MKGLKSKLGFQPFLYLLNKATILLLNSTAYAIL